MKKILLFSGLLAMVIGIIDSASANEVVQTVTARPQWTETSISVTPGDVYSITASGSWRHDR